MKKKRLHRGDPERSRPIRGWDTLYRGDALPEAEIGEPQPQTEPPDNSPWDDVTNRAIERGYEVIEEQIKQGARLAQQFTSGRVFGSSASTNDLSRLLERTMTFYSDFGSLWFELVESLIRSSTRPGTESEPEAESPRFSNGAHYANGYAAAQSGSGNVAIEVDSPFPTVVQLDLSVSPSSSLVAQALRSLDERKPPIKDVSFEIGVGPPSLRIRIPEGQPADTYSGVIFDTRTNQPKGTLSVCIRDDSESDLG